MKRWFATGSLVLLAAAAGLMAGALLASGGGSHKARVPSKVAVCGEAAAHAKRRILYWWAPMIGPSSISPKPGVSAMGMKLVPVYASGTSSSAGEVSIDPAIEQDLAVQTSAVRFGDLHKTLRTVGYFRQASPARYAVSLRVSGWVGTLYATTDGTAIRKGDPLFTLYSPKLLAAQQELLAAAANSALAARTGDADSVREAQRIYASLRRRLTYLGVDASELEHIVQQGRARQYLTFRSPVSGYLAGISIRQKSFISRGRPVMRIEKLRRVWLDAKVYDNQLPWLRLGQLMQARVAAESGRILEGRIFFISPTEDPRTHAVTVRAQFANPGGLLRPGMYALVNILTTPLKHVLLAPASAIIHTGTGEVALLAEGQGRFVPRKVTEGLAGSGAVQVLSGLTAGERVVTSGQFLIDVESNMNELTGKLTARRGRVAHLKTAAAAGSSMAGMKKAPAAGHRGSAAQPRARQMRRSRPPRTGG